MNTMIPAWVNEPAILQQAMPDWQRAKRLEAYQRFINTGFPNRSQEEWKYTDVASIIAQAFTPVRAKKDNAVTTDFIASHRLPTPAHLLVFIDGEFRSEYSDITQLNKEVVIKIVKHEQAESANILKQFWSHHFDAKKFPFANLNLLLAEKALLMQVPENCQLSLPLHLLFITTQNNIVYHPQNLIFLGKNAKVTLLEEHCATQDEVYLANGVNYLRISEAAELNYHKLQTDSIKGFRFTYSHVFQDKHSHLSLNNFSRGGELVRDDVVFDLNAAGATCSTSGLSLLEQDKQLIDHHIDVRHHAPQSRSEMLYKSILNKKSKSVFNGRLHVTPNAQKILAYQANHNLLLSDTSEAYSKPELEIYADDVKCKHGATTGQLNQDALFYMRARGISKDEAIKILLAGFANEVFQKVGHVDIKDYIKGKLS